jgi:hypothetical protein
LQFRISGGNDVANYDNSTTDELLAHQSIMEELEQIKSQIDKIEGKLDLTFVKPIPLQMIKEMADIKELLASHVRNHLNTNTDLDENYISCIQNLGKTIDYLYKLNKALGKHSSNINR